MCTGKNLFFLFLVAMCSRVMAQDPDIDQFHVGAFGSFAFPFPDLREAVDNNVGGLGIGAGASLLVNPTMKRKNSPVFLGLDLNYLTFGRDKTEGTAITPPYKTSFNFYSVCAMMRLYPYPEKIGLTPFVDGMLGLKLVNARTKVDKDIFNTINNDEDEVINDTTDKGLGYALGIGFASRRYREDDDGNMRKKESLTIRITYHWGATATYIKRGSVRIDNGNVTYETGEVKPDMIVMQVGLFVF
jgi:hypothetical protein